MASRPLYRLVLAKEDFKFSSSHFTLFSAERAELLHGHNYRVTLELAGSDLNAWGLLADIETIKASVRALCRRLDSRTLLPAASPALAWSKEGGAIEVRFGSRRYLFPEEDVLVLPLANTSIELLARYFWGELAAGLRESNVEALSVSVEETAGQRCAYESALAPNPD
ncbi:MAG TPA: 6-carboxytetrahydropterin synthase [Thermoanaerobaculia bacterium]|nr:6-carboxytetrahydropterin synthase [Thermoanaerobaculia bacterium]